MKLKSIFKFNYRKLPQSTTLLGDNFGRDYAKDRAEIRRREQERFNEMMGPELIGRGNEENAKKDFMYYNYLIDCGWW